MDNTVDDLDYLYRFRSTESLLGEFRELERQEIYFASPEQLNDPVEGFRDIYWQGDEIVWKNFIKHYLTCLEHVFTLSVIKSENDPLQSSDIAVFKSLEDFRTPLAIEINKEIHQTFLSNAEVVELPKRLAAFDRPIRRGELRTYLSDIHYLALYTIAAVYHEHNMTLLNDINHFKSLFLSKEIMWPRLFDSLNAVDNLPISQQEIAEFAFQFLEIQPDITLDQYGRATDNNGLLSKQLFLFNDFPAVYLQEIEKLIYPHWYTACFMSNPENSAMWGHYADSHRGVCLKFKTHGASEARHINLHGANGIQGSMSGTNIVSGLSKLQLHKIEYYDTYPEVDFFKSLGRLTAKSMQENWLCDENGEKSALFDELFKDKNGWREQYWKYFIEGVTTKTTDWSYESEYRLILSETLLNYAEANTRKFKYNFSDLEGIIFGINTTDESKRKIYKIIKDKCAAENRENFSFYQAFYSRSDGSIKSAKLSLLKLP